MRFSMQRHGAARLTARAVLQDGACPVLSVALCTGMSKTATDARGILQHI